MNAKQLYDTFLAETQDPFQAAYLTLAESNLILAASNQGCVDESSPLKRLPYRDLSAIPGIQMTEAARVISVQEAAQQMAVGTSTVYALCAAQKLPYKRIGQGRGVLRIRQSDLDAYIKANTTEATTITQQDYLAAHH